MNWMGATSDAIAILRVSSKRQEGNASHDIQEQEIRAYCRRKGLNILEIVRLVESAKDSNCRKKYKRALKGALDKKTRHVVFHMFDRETRNLTDSESNEKLVRADRIVLHYVRDDKIFWRETSDVEFLSRDFQAITSKQFARNLSAKTSDAMLAKAEGGWYPGNHPPLGYMNQKSKDSNGRELKRGTTLIRDIDEKRVRQVIREFELRGQGLSYQSIRDQVVSEEFITPHQQRQYRANTVEKRLKNPIYFGRFNWAEREFEGKHELIIPRNLLDAVTTSFKKTYTRRLDKDQGCLAGGWLRCADSSCKCAVVYDPKTKINRKTQASKEYHYYRCSNGKRVHLNMKGMSVQEGSLWSQFGSALDRITLTRERAGEIAQALTEAHSKASGTTRKQIAAYGDSLVELEKREDDLFDKLSTRIIDNDAYQRQIKRVREERGHYKDLLEKAQLSLNDVYHETAKSIIELATDAKSLWLSLPPQKRRDLLDKMLSNPILNGTTVRYDFKKPFAVLVEMNEKTDWRTQCEELRNCVSEYPYDLCA
jgi:DNA invertase Pin-like site-specific DNA recombinase